jgi:uncharacterized protein YjcR
MPIVKYNERLRVELVRLYSMGYNWGTIAKMLGVNPATIYRWKKNDPKLVELAIRARDEEYSEAILVGAMKLAKGAESKEVKKEFIEIDDNGNPIKITETIKVQAPDLKAHELLARKFENESS